MKRAEERDVMVYAIGLAGENGMPDPRGRTQTAADAALRVPGGIGGLSAPADRRLRRPVWAATVRNSKA